MTAAAFAVGGALWVIAAFVFIARRDARAHAARFAGLTLSEVATPAGEALVAIEGEASSEAPITDPTSDASAVYVEARLHERDTRGGSRTVLERTLRAPLTLSNVRIELAHAQLDLPLEEVQRAERHPDARMRALMEAEGITVEERPREGLVYELTRRRIALGDRVLVVGVPRERDGVVRMSSEDGPLIVTSEPLATVVDAERAASVAMDRMLAIAITLGLGSVALGVWLAL